MNLIVKTADLLRVGLATADLPPNALAADATKQEMESRLAHRPRFMRVSYVEEISSVDGSFIRDTTISWGEGSDQFVVLPGVNSTAVYRGGPRLTFIRRNGRPITLKLNKA